MIESTTISILSGQKILKELDVETLNGRFDHKIVHDAKRVLICILDKKTDKCISLSIFKDSSEEVIHNTIKNYIITSIIEVENDKVEKLEADFCPNSSLEELFVIDEKVCPPAPIKKRPRLVRLDPEHTDAIQINQLKFKIHLRPKCKVMLKNGCGCMAEAQKYGRCNYHFQVWKKYNPYLKHP